MNIPDFGKLHQKSLITGAHDHEKMYLIVKREKEKKFFFVFFFFGRLSQGEDTFFPFIS
jgi:hypothetical protein